MNYQLSPKKKSKVLRLEKTEPASTWSIKGLQFPQWLKTIFKSFSPTWVACIPITAIIVIVWNTAAQAQGYGLPENATPEQINTNFQVVLNSVFLLIAATLVIFMNAGFAAVNILSKNLIVFAIASLAYWAIGYGLMYGEGTPFIGTQGFFFNGSSVPYTGAESFTEVTQLVDGAEETIKVATGVPEAINFLFQVAFSATAATIVSGAVAERIKYDAFLIFSFLLVAISYPVTGHWIWDGGWLSEMGFRDFAGSTVVHSVGGWAALMGALILGPRLGKYQDGRVNALPGHNMGFATLGCLILWIGWFGFNPGSELAATANIPYIAVTTNLAASAGGLTATLTSWTKDSKPDLSMTINGILAGLVGVTAGCADVDYWEAIVIGAIAGIIVVFSVSFFDSVLKIDDPVGATSVHLVCGIWGTLAVGIFGGVNFFTQLIGVLAVAAFTIIFSSIVWLALKATVGLRVSEHEEIQGLDIGEHGMEAYSGFVKEADIIGVSSSSSTVGSSATRSEF
jgi:ammonium transporter, Amt family